MAPLAGGKLWGGGGQGAKLLVGLFACFSLPLASACPAQLLLSQLPGSCLKLVGLQFLEDSLA